MTLQVSEVRPAGGPLKLVGYVRVSTERQRERGHGLDVQTAELRRWTRQHGHQLLAVHADEAVSGTVDPDARPGLTDALGTIREGRASGLLVYRLDRLARDLILQEQLLAEVRRLGGRVYSTASGEDAFLADDPSDPSRRLIRQVLGAVSEYERAMIRLRLRAGQRRKAERGGYAGGAPAFGLQARGGELEPREDEQRALQRMRELQCDGASLRAIAAALNAEGLRPKRASVWHPETVRRSLGRIVAQR
ncbi:recombinase family protein [Motilibacter sp. K478]|nr:recombinase family protein [Motilibacter aurantiacus]